MPNAVPARLADRIDTLLPQTQCGQCGYAGCRPYAEAIALDQADINQCPPGGESGIRALARLLDRAPKPLNPDNGTEKPRVVALIDEAVCIGCTKCIQACPVDAIVGAGKLMHTVITDECTGCELCLPPCPVDCIDLVPQASDAPAPATAAEPESLIPLALRLRARHARARFLARNARLARDAAECVARVAAREQNIEAPSTLPIAESSAPNAPVMDKAAVFAAIARAKAKKSNPP